MRGLKASLLQRMILAQGLVLVFGWLFSAALGLWTVYITKKGSFDETLDIVSSALVSLLQDERDPARMKVLAQRVQQLDETFTKLDNLKPGEYRPVYLVLDANRSLIYRSEHAPDAPPVDATEGFHTVLWEGQAYRLRVRESHPQRIHVQVAVPHSLMERLVWRSVRRFPFDLAIMFAVLALLTWPLSRRALKPLRQLAASVESRDPWDLSPLVGQTRLAETQPLLEALNRLFLRVGGLLESQRRFISDAALELRTPLAAIGAQAQMLQFAGEEADRDQVGQALQLGVDRAARLVGQLLTLARLETIQEGSSMSPLDLSLLVHERLGVLLPRALARAQDLGYEGPPTLSILGSSTVLIHALDNLISNAIRHTPAGGRITCRLRAGGGEVHLEVEDTGPGVPAELREQVFERFVPPPLRHPEGAGLGLAIVRRAVSLHGGSVSLSVGQESGGLLVAVRLPQGRNPQERNPRERTPRRRTPHGRTP